MSYEAQELCMRRDYFQIISGEGMGMGDMLLILLDKQSGMTCGVHFLGVVLKLFQCILCI